ncbi:MAG: phosphohistidine swiveling domain-containing protein [Myxococcota bacterium]|jgi:phosphohistidine swiveling domain-containing protein
MHFSRTFWVLAGHSPKAPLRDSSDWFDRADRGRYCWHVFPLSLAYFGVFLVAPLTLALLGILGAALLIAFLVVAVGLDSSGSLWRIISIPLVLLVLASARLGRRVRWMFAPPPVLALQDSAHPGLLDAVGGKAVGLGKIMGAGLPTKPGFVVTSTATLGHWRTRWAIKRALVALPAGPLIIRSSFPGEDRETGSGAGLYLTVPNVGRSVEEVTAALRQVFASGEGAGLAAVVQLQADLVALGVVSSVDPRSGFVEHMLVQRTEVDTEETRVYVVDRLLGQQDVASDACEVLARTDSGPIEIEVGWTRDNRLLVLQLRPLLNVPEVPSWVNGGLVAFPAVPLSPASRERYIGPGIAERMRQALDPIGLTGPADEDIIERDGRFYLRYRPPTEPARPIRYAAACFGFGVSHEDPVVESARAIAIAGTWWSTAESIAPSVARDRAAIEAGVQPTGRPDTPEELTDPGYQIDWPDWHPPDPPKLELTQLRPIKRLVVRFCLRRYRAWLLRRFGLRERILLGNRAAALLLDSDLGEADALERWNEQLEMEAPPVWHPTAPMGAPSTGYGPAVVGVATGPIAFGDPGDRHGVILVVPDSRSIHARHFDRCVGLVVSRGGPLSHLVLLAREAGIPTIIGPPPDLETGTEVTVDGGQGVLTL